MRIFNTEDIRAIDRRTMETDGVSSLELIDRVAQGVASEIAARWRPTKPVVVFAGPGNNGADALAVARILAVMGFSPSVYLLNIGGNKLSRDCRDCRDRLIAEAPGIQFKEETGNFAAPELNSSYLVVDGLFGSGLNNPLAGGFMLLVRYINESGATVVSIDVPSGMNGDLCADSVNRNIVHASLTLTVQFPRPAFFMKENAELVGEWKAIDINLNHDTFHSYNFSSCGGARGQVFVTSAQQFFFKSGLWLRSSCCRQLRHDGGSGSCSKGSVACRSRKSNCTSSDVRLRGYAVVCAGSYVCGGY